MESNTHRINIDWSHVIFTSIFKIFAFIYDENHLLYAQNLNLIGILKRTKQILEIIEN